MKTEDLFKAVKDLKELKIKKEKEIEDIKIGLIVAKNDFYKEHKNYDEVVKKLRTLDNMFGKECDTSINTLHEQLLKIIMKCFDKIVSKKVDLQMQLELPNKSFIDLGLNNNGIGELSRVYRYHGNTDNNTRTNLITDLDTYLAIIKNKAIIEKIKANIFKKEKKEMLDVLHEQLKDWVNPIGVYDTIPINADITMQYRKENDYYSRHDIWNIDFTTVKVKEIQLKAKTNSDWNNGKYVNRKYVDIIFNLTNTNNKEIVVYSIHKPSEYDGYDIEDTYYMACQLWDKLGSKIDEMIKNVKIEQEVKMRTLKEIWDKVSPYLMVEAI